MSLHAISVIGKVEKLSPEKMVLQESTIKCFKEEKIDKWPELPYSFPPIDCCGRINQNPGGLFDGDIQS